jgi:regulator of RNase E activity RraA
MYSRNSAILTNEEIKALASIDTPTIANAMGAFDERDKTEGYASLELKTFFPEYPPVVGYAVTCTEDTASPRRKTYTNYDVLYRAIEASPKPAIVIFKNMGPDRLRGLHMGDMMASLFQRLGAIAAVTDGGVRDVSGVRKRAPGFQLFATGVVASAGKPCLFEVGVAVSICGLTIWPGDLLHGDENGLLTIPISIAEKVVEQAKKVHEKEKEKDIFIKSSDFTLESYLKKYG